MKPGYTTTEFWVTVSTSVLAVVSVVFHTHAAVDVPKVAAAAAGVSNFAYNFSRSHVKGKYLEAEASKLFAQQNAPAPIPVTDASAAGSNNAEAHGL